MEPIYKEFRGWDDIVDENDGKLSIELEQYVQFIEKFTTATKVGAERNLELFSKQLYDVDTDKMAKKIIEYISDNVSIRIAGGTGRLLGSEKVKEEYEFADRAERVEIIKRNGLNFKIILEHLMKNYGKKSQQNFFAKLLAGKGTL